MQLVPKLTLGEPRLERGRSGSWCFDHRCACLDRHALCNRAHLHDVVDRCHVTNVKLDVFLENAFEAGFGDLGSVDAWFKTRNAISAVVARFPSRRDASV